MKNLWLIALLFLMCIPLSAQVQEIPTTSGNAFLRLCSVVDKDPALLTVDQKMGLMSCLSYIQGFSDGETMEWTYVKAVTKQDAPQPFCVPLDVENGQLVRVVLKHILDNPEEAHKPTAILITTALIKAYHCPSK